LLTIFLVFSRLGSEYDWPFPPNGVIVAAKTGRPSFLVSAAICLKAEMSWFPTFVWVSESVPAIHSSGLESVTSVTVDEAGTETVC